MHSICDFEVGDVIEVSSIDLLKYQKERMLSMGFSKGVIVKVIRIGPKNNLMVFDVRGVMIALRNDETRHIYGKKI